MNNSHILLCLLRPWGLYLCLNIFRNKLVIIALCFQVTCVCENQQMKMCYFVLLIGYFLNWLPGPVVHWVLFRKQTTLWVKLFAGMNGRSIAQKSQGWLRLTASGGLLSLVFVSLWAARAQMRVSDSPPVIMPLGTLHFTISLTCQHLSLQDNDRLQTKQRCFVSVIGRVPDSWKDGLLLLLSYKKLFGTRVGVGGG